ncbi:MAG: MFS transporter [Candidatus Saccharibacteria bacterium]
MITRLQKMGRPLLMFAIASLTMGIYSGLYDPSFNNYLAQVHHVSEVVRGSLEFPRELPGFLVAFVIAALLFLADTRIAALSAFLVGIALWGQGFLAPDLKSVIVWMLLWSIGGHVYMTIAPSIGLRLAREGEEGRRLGQLGSLESMGSLMGMGLVYLGSTFLHVSFGVIFGVAATCAIIAAIMLFLIKPEPVAQGPKRLVLKRKYSLFYFLNVLFGARKQIFITFAPWVLIKVFHCGVATFALLGFIGTAMSIAFRPVLGRMIDSLGEKLIIAIESVVLIIICVMYGMAPGWFPAKIALPLIMACYIADQLLFSVRIARITYLNRIADDQQDIAPTLSMGVSIDHLVSMTIPFGGGLLWAYYGFPSVFMVAGGIALLNLLAALMIPEKSQAYNKSED